jgi:hypothetical protein
MGKPLRSAKCAHLIATPTQAPRNPTFPLPECHFTFIATTCQTVILSPVLQDEGPFSLASEKRGAGAPGSACAAFGRPAAS